MEGTEGTAAYYRGGRYRIRQVRAVYVGRRRSHWWMVLEVDKG